MKAYLWLGIATYKVLVHTIKVTYKISSISVEKTLIHNICLCTCHNTLRFVLPILFNNVQRFLTLSLVGYMHSNYVHFLNSQLRKHTTAMAWYFNIWTNGNYQYFSLLKSYYPSFVGDFTVQNGCRWPIGLQIFPAIITVFFIFRCEVVLQTHSPWADVQYSAPTRAIFNTLKILRRFYSFCAITR